MCVLILAACKLVGIFLISYSQNELKRLTSLSKIELKWPFGLTFLKSMYGHDMLETSKNLNLVFSYFVVANPKNRIALSISSRVLSKQCQSLKPLTTFLTSADGSIENLNVELQFEAAEKVQRPLPLPPLLAGTDQGASKNCIFLYTKRADIKHQLQSCLPGKPIASAHGRAVDNYICLQQCQANLRKQSRCKLPLFGPSSCVKSNIEGHYTALQL